MNTPAGCVEIPLTLFGGENTEVAPTDLPEGLSPDCSDVAFAPGRVFTRPPMQRFSTLGTTTQIVYTTSFLKNDGVVVQLVFDSAGGMYADGVKIGQTQAGNRFHTASAFGRCFIATSDGLHGVDVPLAYDGTNLDRVSQDGPGAGPTVANYGIPAQQLVAGAAGAMVALSTATPINPQQVQVGGDDYDEPGQYRPPRYQTYYLTLRYVTSAPHGLIAGETVVIAGNTLYNQSATTVEDVVDPLTFDVGYYGESNAQGTGGTVQQQAPLLSRTSGQVSAYTAQPHNLRTGYQFSVSGVTDLTESATSIVIDTDANPGIAKVTTSAAHGLLPGAEVTITNVPQATVGGGLQSYSVNDSGEATVVTNQAHRLAVGEGIILTFNPSGGGVPVLRIVTAIIDPVTFTVVTGGNTKTSGTTGSVYLNFTTDTSFTVSSVPTPTTFEVSTNYYTGTWNGGTIQFPWNGTFYVGKVTSPTSFTYAQAGPDAVVSSGSGLITPLGQLVPGNRKVVVIFQTRTGYLTVPSPQVTFSAAGGQYAFVSNIPIGPPNVVARVLAFTGANGGEFFYLPVAPQLNGEVVGTSTVVPDNTSTSAIMDFSDAALFASIDIGPKFAPGNNLFEQEILGPCLGFYAYASRLFAWGERNKVQSLLNMGFEGGVLASAPNVPLGWNVSGVGQLVPGDYGMGWQPTGNASLSQVVFQDQYGDAILTADTAYLFRAFTENVVTATISSASTGFSSTATVTAASGFATVPFSLRTPVAMPSDLTLTFSGVGVMDELEIIYAQDPYRLTSRASYVENPEAFDGVTGIVGPANDPQPVMGMTERDDSLCFLTFGPKGSLYQTDNSASGEPATWDVRHKASLCGLLSVWGIGGFEDWFCWASDTGLRIFDGGNVEKISQEEQDWWDSFDPTARQFTVVTNDPNTRRIYILAAVGSSHGTPNTTYVLDYRDLNTAALLTNSGTLRVALSGKVLTTDLTRKWSPWSCMLNYCAVVQLASGQSELVMCGGYGDLTQAGHSATYTLQEGSLAGIDDDYGAFWQSSYYWTYFFIGSDQAQQFKLGSHRLLHQFMSLNVSGIGLIQVTPALNRSGNYGKTSRWLSVTPDIARDLEIGLNLAAERISYRVACKPDPTVGPQAGFILSLLSLAIKTDPYANIRGLNRG